MQWGCSRENLIFLSVGTSLKLGFCGKPNWAQRLNGNISHNFQCILSGNSNFPTFHRHLGILGSGWISIWAACHIFGKYYIFENEVKRDLDSNGKWVISIEILPYPHNITHWEIQKKKKQLNSCLQEHKILKWPRLTKWQMQMAEKVTVNSYWNSLMTLKSKTKVGLLVWFSQVVWQKKSWLMVTEGLSHLPRPTAITHNDNDDDLSNGSRTRVKSREEEKKNKHSAVGKISAILFWFKKS